MQFGGLGVLAVFAWLLLKGLLKQQETNAEYQKELADNQIKIADLLNNHLSVLLRSQEEEYKCLTELCQSFVEFRAKWENHRELTKELRDK
uniref:Uncharacterized protein n=1 Tax=viral metagenome TaxID=1070528 RepID=A0A6M3KQ86_9ZZZZ